jgi:putative FmdB family regulatory protein
MPTYSFTCESCEKSFESFLTMSKCDEPLGEPCPECGESGKVRKAYSGGFNVGIDHNHRCDRPIGGAFQERMQHIADNYKALDKEGRANIERHTSR